MSTDRRPGIMPGNRDNNDKQMSLVEDMRLSILLIDDMKPLLTILQSGLKRYGQTVFTAQSGEEGMEIFKTSQIDVVICDLGMEGMDGWQVGRNVQEISDERGQTKPPFILMTGWGYDISDRELASRSGVDMVLEKPVEIPHLIKILCEVVGNRRSSGS